MWGIVCVVCSVWGVGCVVLAFKDIWLMSCGPSGLTHHLADELWALGPDSHALSQADGHGARLDLPNQLLADPVKELVGGAEDNHVGIFHSLGQVLRGGGGRVTEGGLGHTAGGGA